MHDFFHFFLISFVFFVIGTVKRAWWLLQYFQEAGCVVRSHWRSLSGLWWFGVDADKLTKSLDYELHTPDQSDTYEKFRSCSTYYTYLLLTNTWETQFFSPKRSLSCSLFVPISSMCLSLGRKQVTRYQRDGHLGFCQPRGCLPQLNREVRGSLESSQALDLFDISVVMRSWEAKFQGNNNNTCYVM